ncbi:MAG: hypothetical protein LAT62_13715 [Natronospirillum sp.]|uniref:hypothetical protein n=1 Tax=Natronospirillum sp. TaxID=2812955 RepID=UPI0025E8CC00|nr:hypothetical protein [Natronospirillum sp.]MCH8552989.1 hypothetical protein [Natronospirillum sp.]
MTKVKRVFIKARQITSTVDRLNACSSCIYALPLEYQWLSSTLLNASLSTSELGMLFYALLNFGLQVATARGSITNRLLAGVSSSCLVHCEFPWFIDFLFDGLFEFIRLKNQRATAFLFSVLLLVSEPSKDESTTTAQEIA